MVDGLDAEADGEWSIVNGQWTGWRCRWGWAKSFDELCKTIKPKPFLG